jgi:hypothetical protein
MLEIRSLEKEQRAKSGVTNAASAAVSNGGYAYGGAKTY